MPRTLTSVRTPESAPRRSCATAAHGRRHPGPVSKAAAILLAILGTCLVAGCAVPAQAGPLIQLSSAQVTEPGASRITNVYVDVQNNGAQAKLIAARLSVGGRVTLRSPVRPGQAEMRTVQSITIPAKSFVGLDPNGAHLLVTNAGPMRAGTVITLTLVFARLGSFSVPAMVTNPESGGSSYFLN